MHRTRVAASLLAAVCAAPSGATVNAVGMPTQHYFGASAVSGSVIVGSGSALSFVSFVVEERTQGGLRMFVARCTRDGRCAATESMLAGSVDRDGPRVTVTGRSTLLGGAFRLTGERAAAPAVASQSCRVSYVTGQAGVSLVYDLVGSQSPVTWSGSLGRARAWAPAGFGCGRDVNPGVVRVTR